MRVANLLLALALVLAVVPSVRAQQGGGRYEAMQKEKLRLLQLRSKLMMENASTLEKFRQLNARIAEGNAAQYRANQKAAIQLLDYAERAEKKRLYDKQKTYLRLSKIYEQYAKANERLVKAYKELDSGTFRESLAEIEDLEKQIVKLGMKPVTREWFTPNELKKVPLPGQEAPQTGKTTDGGATAGK